VKRLLRLLLFLVFVEDWGAAYNIKPSSLGAPMGWAHLLLDPTPLKLRPFDMILLVVLIVSLSRRDKASALVAPMRNALLLMLATTILWFAYGLATGADFRHASWQTYLILSTVLLAFTVGATFRTAADFYALGTWLIVAAIYRAFMCWLSYFTWAHALVGETGIYLTTHDDTILWVVSVLVLIVNTFEKRSTRVTLRNVAIMLFLIVAIHFNSRRLAWVSFAMGLVVMYALLPPGVAKRRLNRIGWYALPLFLVYYAVGQGSTNLIFLPVHSIATVATHEDSSTLARNAENLGLITTANASSFALGTGWGKPYTPIFMKYDISFFELWQYVPHNSILGLLAFTGALGFAGFWMAFPTAVFLNSRMTRLSKDPKARSVGIIGAAQLVVCANQLYGDMGIFFIKPMYVIAVSYAMALRLPRVTGTWETVKSTVRAGGS
jgi:hypothetical protein